MLTCAICLDIVFQPVSAPCSHAFCRACLRRLLEFSADGAACPKCRQPLRMAAESLTIDESLAVLATKHFRDRLDGRDEGIADEDKEYRVCVQLQIPRFERMQAARAEREHNEALMENNPLEVVFETEAPSPRADAMRVRSRHLRRHCIMHCRPTTPHSWHWASRRWPPRRPSSSPAPCCTRR